MERVKSQAAVVSQLLFDPKTADAYKSVVALTGKIIQEVAVLLWLLICSVFVFAAWFSDTAVSTGKNARQWWESQQAETTDGNQAAAATGQALLDVSQNGAYFLLDKAREQLGLDKLERSAKMAAPAAAKPVAQKTPASSTARVTPAAKDTASKGVADSSQSPVVDKH